MLLVVLSLSLLVLHKISFSMDDIFILKQAFLLSFVVIVVYLLCCIPTAGQLEVLLFCSKKLLFILCIYY